jgi:alpha-glucosidase (family GH31 glycosyl hydrolase)
MTLPLARSLLVESPKEEPVDTTDFLNLQQYMLGPSILVSPILRPNSDPHQIYFPLIRNVNNSTTPLYSFYDGARVSENSQGKTVEMNATSLPPIFIKGDSIILLIEKTGF